MKNKTKVFLYLSLGFLVLVGLGYLVNLLTKNLDIKQLIRNAGLLGPFLITIGISISGIIVPITSLPFLLAGLALYGFWPTFIFYYLGNTVIAPCADFWIARKYGRPAIAKLAGKKSLDKIDKIAEIIGLKVLILLRIFGGILFDSVSYATGLTEINFWNFFWITTILPVPGMLISLYFLYKGLTSNYIYFGLIIFWGYLVGTIATYSIFKNNKNRL